MAQLEEASICKEAKEVIQDNTIPMANCHGTMTYQPEDSSSRFTFTTKKQAEQR